MKLKFQDDLTAADAAETNGANSYAVEKEARDNAETAATKSKGAKSTSLSEMILKTVLPLGIVCFVLLSIFCASHVSAFGVRMSILIPTLPCSLCGVAQPILGCLRISVALNSSAFAVLILTISHEQSELTMALIVLLLAYTSEVCFK